MKLSIITINFNNSEGLDKTIKSVLSQSFKNFEFIIIDGGSTDNSVEVIKQNLQGIDYWISERDKGIYHAMNKGSQVAQGEYFLFLNSGDILNKENILEEVAFTGEDLIYGDLVVVDSVKEWLKTYPSSLTFNYFLKDTLPHPATFIKKSLFHLIGNYDENNKIVSDWQFFLLAVCKYNCSYKYIPITVTNFRYDGISSKPENFDLVANEKHKFLKNEFAAFLPDYEDLQTIQKDLNEYRRSRVIKFYLRVKSLIN